MKTTYINAGAKLAGQIAEDFLSRTDIKGKPIFKKRKTNEGFELTARFEGKIIVLFRFTDVPVLRRFEYDERLLTFDNLLARSVTGEATH